MTLAKTSAAGPMCLATDIAGSHRHKMRETLAWTGVGHWFADHLRCQVTTLPNVAVPEVSRGATSIVTRLDTEPCHRRSDERGPRAARDAK
jgi:hypothetical protein